ncbi:MAG: hypothetical protein ABIQ58_04265 [Candidatus Limnocylindrales bacterium]
MIILDHRSTRSLAIACLATLAAACTASPGAASLSPIIPQSEQPSPSAAQQDASGEGVLVGRGFTCFRSADVAFRTVTDEELSAITTAAAQIGPAGGWLPATGPFQKEQVFVGSIEAAAQAHG